MRQVNLIKYPYFRAGRLEQLNEVFYVNDDIMPHVIAGATSCTIVQALEVLMLLYHLGHASPGIVVYHRAHPDIPLEVRSFSKGFPDVPYMCLECDRLISDPKDFYYDFLFKLKDEIIFEVREGTDAV